MRILRSLVPVATALAPARRRAPDGTLGPVRTVSLRGRVRAANGELQAAFEVLNGVAKLPAARFDANGNPTLAWQLFDGTGLRVQTVRRTNYARTVTAAGAVSSIHSINGGN